MRISLRAKIAFFVTLTVLIISTVSIYLFVSQHKRQIENAFVARGATLSYLLSRIAREGIEKEKLDLIEKAAFIIQAEDVTKVRVYTDLWDLLEAYPETDRPQSAVTEEARRHFAGANAAPSPRETENVYVQQVGPEYRFFHNVMYQPYENARLITIGYVRVDMTAQPMRTAIVLMLRNNILAALFITAAAIAALSLLIGRIIVRPITDIYRSVRMFKEGHAFEMPAGSASDEIGDLAGEFTEMSRTIKEKENMLIQSEQQLVALFERAEHAIFRLDQDGAIIKANGKFTELFGDQIARMCEILLGEKRILDYLGNGRAEHLEEKVVGKNGEELVVLLSLYADTGPGGAVRGIDGYMLDITARRKAEQALKVTEEYYRVLFENAHDMIQSVGPDGKFLFVNPAWARTLGYSAEDLAAMSMLDVISPGHRESCASVFQRIMAGEELKNYQTAFLAKDGRTIAVEGNVNAHVVDGAIIAAQGMFRDITDRKLFEDYLQNMAHYDDLTGLPNRALFHDRLGQALSTARRTGEKLALLYFDLDNFKPVNDRLGHKAGDLLLREAAQRLRKCVRESDTVARVGGDEFCVILPNVKWPEDAEIVSGKLLSALRRPFIIQDQECRVGISIGISMFPDNGDDAETLIRNADAAMYQVKHTGKNSFHLYSSDASADAECRTALPS